MKSRMPMRKLSGATYVLPKAQTDVPICRTAGASALAFILLFRKERKLKMLANDSVYTQTIGWGAVITHNKIVVRCQKPHKTPVESWAQEVVETVREDQLVEFTRFIMPTSAPTEVDIDEVLSGYALVELCSDSVDRLYAPLTHFFFPYVSAAGVGETITMFVNNLIEEYAEVGDRRGIVPIYSRYYASCRLIGGVMTNNFWDSTNNPAHFLSKSTGSHL